jgi:hypothetical protein
MSNPYEYKVSSDRDGFWIEDEFGEDVTPTRRYPSWGRAMKAIAQMIEDYEPSETGDAWTGGFANNH